MNTAKINDLDSVYLAAINIVTQFNTGVLNEKSLREIFAPSFYLYGLDNIEISDFSQFTESLQKQKNSSENSKSKSVIKNRPVFRSYSQNGEAAVYVDELKFDANDTTNSDALKKRISLVLYKLPEGWRVTHLHISEPPINDIAKLFPKEEWEKEKTALEKLVEARTTELKDSGELLKEIRTQLLRQEKLASLGQLTAGIAHEIKNPLNFINNFSELSAEFLSEIDENLEKLETNEITNEIKSLLEDVKGNLEKIHQHGTRADGIVKSMLLHSRGGNGKMEDTDLNALIREYVNLSFHGMRANKNPINVDIKIETEDSLQPVKLNPENFSRVILNLCKNAFDAMREKLQKKNNQNYLPQLKVKTRSEDNRIIVEIEDNGPGVPDEIKEKMMLPFFTTKKGSEGTGLGLSISQDIIKSHGGTLELDTKEGEFTRFIISLNG